MNRRMLQRRKRRRAAAKLAAKIKAAPVFYLEHYFPRQVVIYKERGTDECR